MKKENRTVFEYFKTENMIFTGSHRDYIDQMWELNKMSKSFFKRLVDLYAIAAIVGLRVGRKSPADDDGTDIKRTIQIQQLNDLNPVLTNIMRMVLLFDDSRGLSTEQRLESAFVIPEDKETYSENMELFNSYARGGIEYLYEQLILRSPDIEDDYTDKRIANIYALISQPLERDILA